MFTNAFLNARGVSPITLVAPTGSATWRSARSARRAIERWQTKAFVQAALDAFCVKSTYGLEQLLMKEDTKLVFPDDRPRLFDRMAHLGEPAVAKQIAMLDKESASAKWLRRLLERTPTVRAVLEEPIWRLLDPTPLSHVEWHDLADWIVSDLVKSKKVSADAWVVWVSENRNDEPVDHYVPRAKECSRFLLTRLLMSVRRWETHGELLGYYLNLHEAVQLCGITNPEADLAVLQPDCGDFLAQCFGRVHIGHPHQSNYDYQHERLQAAHTALLRAKTTG